MEDFEVRSGAEGREEWVHLPKSGRIVEFFDSVDELPELFETIEVVMINVDRKELVACALQDLVEDRSGCLLEVDGGPQG